MQSKGYAAVMELVDGTRFINLRTVSGTREGVEKMVKTELEGWYMEVPPMKFVEIVPVVVTIRDGGGL